MKTMKFLLGLCLGFALAGCSSDKVCDFMPGTYVNSAGGEFSVASDTLKVELVEGNQYRVFRRAGYNLLRDGRIGKREFGAEVWSCAYSTDTKTLTELKKGKMISFYPDSGILKVGRRIYKKIN